MCLNLMRNTRDYSLCFQDLSVIEYKISHGTCFSPNSPHPKGINLGKIPQPTLCFGKSIQSCDFGFCGFVVVVGLFYSACD